MTNRVSFSARPVFQSVPEFIKANPRTKLVVERHSSHEVSRVVARIVDRQTGKPVCMRCQEPGKDFKYRPAESLTVGRVKAATTSLLKDVINHPWFNGKL